MSQISDDFFELFKPFLEKEGFKFKKSQNAFIKIFEDLSFKVSFKFDGSGGLASIDWIDYSISVFELEKIFKKITYEK